MKQAEPIIAVPRYMGIGTRWILRGALFLMCLSPLSNTYSQVEQPVCDVVPVEQVVTLLYSPQAFYSTLPECESEQEHPSQFKCRGCQRYQFLPSITYECHHDPPRDPQNPNEGLTPCKDGCVIMLCCEERFRTLRGDRAGACISSAKSAHEQGPDDRRASSQQSNS